MLSGKTTVEIAPALLNEAKQAAHEQGTTLKALVEEALRMALDQRSVQKRFRPQLAPASLGRPLVSTWAEPRHRIYAGHGGEAAGRPLRATPASSMGPTKARRRTA